MVWEAAGRPEPNWQGKARTVRAVPPVRDGVCALTGARGDVVDLRHVLSDLFTTWDRLPHRLHPDAGLSIPAAWAFRERIAMQQPHALVDGRWTQVDAPALFDALASFGPSSVVTVPQSRQKHLLPYVELGTVRVDDESLPWTPADAARLETYAQLRSLGYGETALSEREPRWALLNKHGTEDRRWVLSHWHDLDVWRAHPSYLDVAARATRQPKETK